MSPNDHSTLPQPIGEPQHDVAQSAASSQTPASPAQAPQSAGQPSAPSTNQPGVTDAPAWRSKQDEPRERTVTFSPYEQPAPKQEPRPVYTPPTYIQNQPSYASPFPAAPQRPAYPYQPLSANPAPNPYWASPELPQVAQNTAQQPLQPQRPAQPAPRPAQARPTPNLPPISPQHHQTHATLVKHQASRKKKLIIIAALLVCALLAGLAAWWYTAQVADKKQAKPSLPPITQPLQEESPKPMDTAPKVTPVALSTLELAEFTDPGTVPPAYKPYDYKNAGVTAYVTEGKTCELQYGMLDADALPGADGGDVVKQQVGAMRKNGASADDPVKTTDFKVKKTDDDKTVYIMENFVVTGTLKNGKHFRSYYAVTILKDDTRAYVLRSCNNAQPVGDDAMKDVDAFASTVSIKSAE